MASIDNLKSILNNRFSDGRLKLRCSTNEDRPSEMKGIYLYYNGQNSFCTQTRASYYNNGVQVCVRHNDYDKARTISYNILEYINMNRKTYSTVYFDPDSVPEYLGESENHGGYVWAFNLMLRGGK